MRWVTPCPDRAIDLEVIDYVGTILDINTMK